MAGASVGVVGAGMLRARRRDVSVKPNRKLDRKSSRGMIYENEELRLRTININAEVEQGQNDIKKLRRENEQLRHEIWSLRDEYDKLEEILKAQKNREGSEDCEDRSEEEDKDGEECSDYSDEEADEDCDEKEKEFSESNAEDDTNQDERLENAENQKISSEKMSSNHRLHVEFDDLSVVDEEEELKKDKESKEAVAQGKEQKERAKNGYQRFPYDSPGAAKSYFPERSLIFPNSERTDIRGILEVPSPMLLAACPRLYDDYFPSVIACDPTCVPNPATYDENLRQDQMTYKNPVGWQHNVFPPNIGFQGFATQESPTVMFNSPGQSSNSARTASTARAGSLTRVIPIDDKVDCSERITNIQENVLPNLLQRRNLLPRNLDQIYRENVVPSHTTVTEVEIPSSAEMLTRNGWDFQNGKVFRNEMDYGNLRGEQRKFQLTRDISADVENLKDYEQPRHFFAPLSAKYEQLHQDSGDKVATRGNVVESPGAGLVDSFGTGKSSSSDRTNSTVVSAKHFPCASLPNALMEFLTDNNEKGPADVYVSGGVPAYSSPQSNHHGNEERTYKSSENLLVGENSRAGSSRQGSNPLMKSVSCHDLSSEKGQNSLFEMTFQTDGKCQKFAKSDNTLDNGISQTGKPFKSQLNVTLKIPTNNNDQNLGYSPETPEIPKLPTMDYRLFNNPFLKTFDTRGASYRNYDIRNPVTSPLAVQVSEEKLLHQAPIDYSMLAQPFTKRFNLEDVKARHVYGEMENDRHVSPASRQVVDPRVISKRQNYQVTSFEAPSPRNLHPGMETFDPLSALSTSNRAKLYQNVPFVPGTPGIFCSEPHDVLRMLAESQMQKVPAQTQTSIDGGSIYETETPEEPGKSSKTSETENRPDQDSPTSRRKKHLRKERNQQKNEEKCSVSPAIRRKHRKQSNVEVIEDTPDQSKSTKSRQLSPSKNTRENAEEKNESRSSSSGQESPKKERNRRVSMYFNRKKCSSIASARTSRSYSIDNARDNLRSKITGDAAETTNSERERTNSASSRDTPSAKVRKSSVSSGKVPWCACWGNGCI